MFQCIPVVRGPDDSIPSGPAARKRHLANARHVPTQWQSIEVSSVGTSRPFQEARESAVVRAATSERMMSGCDGSERLRYRRHYIQPARRCSNALRLSHRPNHPERSCRHGCRRDVVARTRAWKPATRQMRNGFRIPLF